MTYAPPWTIHPSTARTVTGNGATFGVADMGQQVSLLVNVTAVSGTAPTLLMGVQWSHDGGVNWADSDVAETFVSITAVKVTVKQIFIKGPHVRLTWVIAGTTPSFTFAVTAFATGS